MPRSGVRNSVIATLVIGLAVWLAGTLGPHALSWAYVHRAESRVAAMLVSPATKTPVGDYALLNEAFHAQNTGLAVLLVVCIWAVYLARRAYRARSGWLGPSLAACAVLVLALTSELVVRAVQMARAGTPFTARTLADPELGWLGLRANLGKGRPRVLVIGDSFTDGVGIVPAEQVYASLLQRSTGLPLVVRAASGWGTLQELLALERVKRELGFVPAQVIVQMTWNDLINNSFEMSSRSIGNAALRARPFLIDGKVEQRYTDASGALAPYSAALASALDLYLRARRHPAIAARWGGPEEQIERVGAAYPPLRRSEELTSRLLTRIAQSAHGARIAVFPATLDEPYLTALRRAAAAAGVTFLEEIPRAVEAAASRGVEVRQHDGMHWSAAGHEIVAGALARWLQP